MEQTTVHQDRAVTEEALKPVKADLPVHRQGLVNWRRILGHERRLERWLAE